jgi:hypothetical protein
MSLITSRGLFAWVPRKATTAVAPSSETAPKACASRLRSHCKGRAQSGPNSGTTESQHSGAPKPPSDKAWTSRGFHSSSNGK